LTQDVLLNNATVITLDPARPSATAIGVRGDRIAWVGQAEDADRDFSGNAREVDLGGATVAPGFIDAHHHIMTLGFWMSQIECAYPQVTSINQIVDAVAQRSLTTPQGEWILGRGYDDNKLAERRHLSRHDLDRVSPKLRTSASRHYPRLRQPVRRSHRSRRDR
jgi:predicted amidohydrolase YtcJ